MKTATAGEVERRLHDPPARAPDPGFGRDKISGVDHHKWSTRRGVCVFPKSAGESAVFETDVFRAAVHELPSEDSRIVLFDGSDVGGGEFDVVDLAVVRVVFHGDPSMRQPSCHRCVSYRAIIGSS